MTIQTLELIDITAMSINQVMRLMERAPEFIDAAEKAAGRSLIGGVPVTGADSHWFLGQWLQMVQQYPQVLDWSAGQVQQAIEGLWILDPEDLMGLV
jgi:hypothetical protein